MWIRPEEGECKATRKRGFKIAWREAGPLDHFGDKVDRASRLSIKGYMEKGIQTPVAQGRFTKII